MGEGVGAYGRQRVDKHHEKGKEEGGEKILAHCGPLV